MADRYWVGGTGSWDATTTNWSATNGGAGGASVPTSADDVFFTSLSNATAYVVTLTSAPVCRSVSVVGPATGNVTIAGSAAWQIFGSLTIAASGVTWTNTSAIAFSATTTGFTITTNGVSLPNVITLSGVGGEWTLGSALTTTAQFIFNAGTFSTNNFSFTCTSTFTSILSTARTLNLGSSAISVLTWNCLGSSNLTVNAGTSTITVTQALGTFAGGGLTYYNVFKNSNGLNIADAGNTFNALTNNTAVAGTFPFQFAGNQTIGTLTVNGGATATNRITIQTTTALIGTQVTLTVGSFVTNGNIDFRDINIAGAASPLTVATGGDCGNNTNITLAAPKTVYWNFAAGSNYNGTVWALTSGGAPAAANYPLPQDTIIIEDTGLNSGATVTINVNANIGTLNISSRTLPMTLALGANTPVVYNNLTLSSAVTVTSSTASLLFQGFSKTQTVTSAGVTVNANFTVNNPSTTVTLADNTTLGTTKTFTLTFGTLDLANHTLSCGLFSTNNSNTRSITFGTSQINLTGNATVVLNMVDLTNFTYTGTPNFYATYSGSTGTRTFNLGSTFSLESNVPNIYVSAGSDTLAFGGNAYIGTLDTTGFTGTINFATSFTRIWRNLVIGAGATLGGAATGLIFPATAAPSSITTNGVTLNLNLTFSGTQTYTLQDATTSTVLVNLNTGTLNLNAQTLTSGTFGCSGTGIRSIAFNGGTIAVSGATFTASGSNLTTTGSGIISMTSASSKTFAGGGFSYPTLNQGGAGTLVITGANTFANMTNTVQPATITFPASTTTTVSNFNVNGTAGNLVTLNSSTPGTRFTLLKI